MQSVKMQQNGSTITLKRTKKFLTNQSGCVKLKKLLNGAGKRRNLRKELEKILEAKVIIIESLVSDMTGHTDGMVRFVNESTLLINESPYKNGLEQRIKKQLCTNGFNVIDFPYSESKGISAEGCYLNYYETPNAVFIPVFKQETAVRLKQYALAVPQNAIGKGQSLLHAPPCGGAGFVEPYRVHVSDFPRRVAPADGLQLDTAVLG